MINLHDAIIKINPQVTVICDDVAYDADGNEVAYDLQAVEALMVAEAYKDLRAKEYPPIADQLDYIYHNGIDAWKKDMIDPVKTKYPKGVA